MAESRERPDRGVPLRLSLVRLTVVLLLAGLVVSGVAVTSALRADLVSRVDADLAGAVDTWARPPAPGDGPLPGPPPGPARPPSDYFVQFTAPDGETVTVNDLGSAPDLAGVSADPLSSDVGPVTVGSAGDGPQWRVLQRTGPSGTTVVARPLTDVDATVTRLVWLQVGVGAAVLVLIAVLSHLLVRAGLRPLRRVEETAHAIAAGDLSRRVPAGSPNTETGSLAASLNTMLGQIGTALAASETAERQARASEDRMRRFVADAGHELRTPLTSIKGFAELYRQGGVDDPAPVMAMIGQEADRMGLLVEDLLTLAHLDADRPLVSEPVDLLGLAADAIQTARITAPDREIELRVVAGDEPPVVAGDPARLTQVLRNLLDNAVVHTPVSASITVEIAVEPAAGGTGDEVVLTVADTGEGLSEAEAAQVFDRFYRGDSSRHRGAGGGSGLGLSIVASLVEAHGGTVGVDTAPGDGARFRVRLPRLVA